MHTEFTANADMWKLERRQFPAEIKERIISLVKTNYYDANWNHLVELLKRFDDIKLSYYALHNLLINHNIISPKCHKDTRKAIAENIHNEVIETSNKVKTKFKSLVVKILEKI